MELRCEIRNSQVERWKASFSKKSNTENASDEDDFQVTKKKSKTRIATGFADSSESEDEDWMMKTAEFGTPTQVPESPVEFGPLTQVSESPIASLVKPATSLSK